MQIANFEERCAALKELLEKPIAEMNQIKTLDISRALEKNVSNHSLHSITLLPHLLLVDPRS